MANRRRIEERARRKESEIQELEAQLREARSYLQALQDVLRMLPRDGRASPSGSTGDAESELRQGSMVADAKAIILREGRPQHISALLREMGKEVTRKNRASLSGSLSAYVRREEIFTRPAPNTFGLIELDEAKEADDIPETFGLDEAIVS